MQPVHRARATALREDKEMASGSIVFSSAALLFGPNLYLARPAVSRQQLKSPFGQVRMESAGCIGGQRGTGSPQGDQIRAMLLNETRTHSTRLLATWPTGASPRLAPDSRLLCAW
jgi:hypothetical protein